MVFRRYKDKFLDYINKKKFDHTQGIIDPLEYHTLFVAFAKLFNVISHEKLPMWMYIFPTVTAISAITAVTIFSISIVEYVRTFRVYLIIECGTYLLIMIYKLLITYSIICTGRKQYHHLLKALRDDFHYICTTGQKYREKFFENQRRAFKDGVLIAIFLGSIGSGIASCGCIAVAVTIKKQEAGAARPLPYPYWLFNYNLHASPTYEILFIISMLFTFFHTSQYIFMIQSQVMWVREITCKADVITWNLRDLLVDVLPANSKEETEYYAMIIKQRMKKILEMHHDMFRLLDGYAAIFKKCLVYEKMVAAPITCMTAYCFAEKYDVGKVHVIFLLLCTSVVVVVFVPCYLCTNLLEKVQSVSDACYDMAFWTAGPVIRPYLVLIMQRSMRSLPIAAAGFDDTSLETFAHTMTRAYSCFNMLRQADFNLS